MQLLSCFALRIRHVEPQIAHTFSTVVVRFNPFLSCFIFLLLLLFLLVFDCFLFLGNLCYTFGPAAVDGGRINMPGSLSTRQMVEVSKICGVKVCGCLFMGI